LKFWPDTLIKILVFYLIFTGVLDRTKTQHNTNTTNESNKEKNFNQMIPTQLFKV